MPADDRKLREIIEEEGRIFEKFGLTPMQGRIVACFMVSDTPEKTFEELVNYFKASKSSVSNSLNWLLQNKIIDYKTFSADRKRHFFLTDAFFRVYFSKVLENVAELKQHAYRTVSMRSPEFPAASEKILRWIGNANMIEEAVRNTLRTINEETP